jgi:nucleotide-binding universal stress UspA family protein
MKPIIVSTDFSDNAKNALDFVCRFIVDEPVKVYVAHIYLLPTSYSAEGISLSTLNESIDAESEMLQKEMDRICSLFPHIPFEAKLIEGAFFSALQELAQNVGAQMVVMGAKSDYSEIWNLGNIWQETLLNMDCPVWIIPKHHVYKPIKHIALSFDYTRELQPHQITFIYDFLKFSKADFHIVHVKKGESPTNETVNQALHKAFEPLHPHYHVVHHSDVIEGIASFIKNNAIDNLIVAPHQHSVLHKLFNKSYSARLALLNHIPVLAVREM